MTKVDRSQWGQPVDVNALNAQNKKAEKTMYLNDRNQDWVKFAKMEKGKNIFRVLPSKTGRPYLPVKTAKLQVLQDIKDKDGNPTGEKEIKEKNVFTADIHGYEAFQGWDLLIAYLKRVYALADEIQDRDERDKFLSPVSGCYKGSKWQWGCKPMLQHVCYVLQGNSILKLQLDPKQMKAMNTISLDLSEGEDEGLTMDVFSNPEEGRPLCINWQIEEQGKKKKNVFSVSAVGMSKDHANLKEYFAEHAVPDEVLSRLSQLPTLEKEYENIYTRREWDWTMEHIRRFDKQNGYNVFTDEEFLAEIARYDKVCPEFVPRNSSKADAKEGGEKKQSANDDGYPTPMKMRKELNAYIENEYGDPYELPAELSLSDLKVWYDLMKAEKMLPFDDMD